MQIKGVQPLDYLVIRSNANDTLCHFGGNRLWDRWSVAGDKPSTEFYQSLLPIWSPSILAVHEELRVIFDL